MTGRAKRREVQVPEDLLDDELELARYVVSVPDLVLLVDGDSAAKLGWPNITVAERRDTLVTYLAVLSADSGAAPDVVFDGRVGEERSLPASRSVRIRLSTPPTAPTAALDELVDAYPKQWAIAVVTDDDELATSAADRGAIVLSNDQLLELFINSGDTGSHQAWEFSIDLRGRADTLRSFGSKLSRSLFRASSKSDTP